MNVISLTTGTKNIRLAQRDEPKLTIPDGVKLRVIRVGICGTDREEAEGGRCKPPAGQTELVIGHEMFGQVVEIGSAVVRVNVGDYAVFTVRRGCGKCVPCEMNRPDMCHTGEFTERGIWGADGYQAEFVVDKEQYIVRVPPELESVGVLAEPLSVAEKAVDEAVRIQVARLPDAPATPNWLFGRRCLVAGIGPIGLLGALVLRLRGAEVFGLDIVDAGTARPAWLEKIGGKYINSKQLSPDKIVSTLGPMDLLFESTGVAGLAFNLLDVLGWNGVYVLTGIPGGDRPLEIPGAQLIRQLVLDNQAMVGSVNAARDHYQMGVDDLRQAHALWPGHIDKLITNRFPAKDFMKAFDAHPVNDIKSVIEWK
ncbi:MAG TPA: glucose 1-dehydrogenase [Verrucomicrobiae bacterium]|jgi:threonine dehydrogenase-like Zn-dependent dehydrogenase|nr:glucose 1-dehydrogenase [Verrucomicrobiae bacterium]